MNNMIMIKKQKLTNNAYMELDLKQRGCKFQNNHYITNSIRKI